MITLIVAAVLSQSVTSSQTDDKVTEMYLEAAAQKNIIAAHLLRLAKEQDDNADRLIRNRVKNRGDKVRELREEAARLRQEASEIQDLKGYIPFLRGNLAKGKIGRLKKFEVLQKLADDMLIVNATWCEDNMINEKTDTIVLMQVGTENITSGGLYKADKTAYMVVGTTSYTNLLGGTTTVFGAVPIDVSGWIEAEEKRRAALAEESEKALAEESPAKPDISEAERKEKQASLKLQLAKRYRDRDPIKAADYARQAISLAPGTETAREAQRLLDRL